MTTNPMQRKARMYLLLGVLITLIVTGAIIALLGMQLLNIKKEQDSYGTVYVLQSSVKSGSSVAGAISVKVPNQAVPQDAVKVISDKAVAKLDLTAGTTLTESMIADSEEVTTDDIRMQEYNMIVLPTELVIGDYIDIRLQLPNGQDFIVISKKKVENANADTIWMKLSEDETLTMSSAIVEAYIMTGSKLYAVTYVEAGNQKQAVATYMPNSAVVDLINTDSNITAEAKSNLNQRYTDGVRAIRGGDFQNILNQYADSSLENIQAGMAEQITKSKEARQQYVEGL